MNHSNTRPYMPQLLRDAMLSEITACDQKITAVTGKTPMLFRPPTAVTATR